MKIARLLIIALTLAFVSSGCNATEDGVILFGDAIGGSGESATDVRSLPPITGVRLATIGRLTIELGDKYELVVEADDNLLQHFVTKVDDGMLTIKTEDRISMRTRSDVRFTLTVPALSRIVASSSGDIVAPVLSAERFEAVCSSSGDIRLNGIKAREVELQGSSSGDMLIGGIKAEKVEIRLSSSGDCRVRDGNTGRLDAQLSSSGDLDCSGLEAREAIVRASSSGDARIWVTDRLRAESSSSGDILFRGDPEKVSSSATSSGDIKRL